MNLIGIGLGIAMPSMDEAKLDDSFRPNQIDFRPHDKSITIKCEEPPRNPNFSDEKYWIPSQLLYLDCPLKASLPCEERKGNAPPEQPCRELLDSGHGKAEASPGQLIPRPDKSNSPISCSNEQKPKSNACKPGNATAAPAGSCGFLSHCFYCSKQLQEGKDIFFCRDRAFCSLQCQWMEIFSCGLGESFERSLRGHPRR